MEHRPYSEPSKTEYTTMIANYHTHTWRCNHAYGVEKQYIEKAIEAGKFLYFAHPDLLNHSGDPDLYEQEMRKLCRYCKEKDIPLEINLLGVRQDRSYPCERFWKIAAQEGNTVIYGSDAHWPGHVLSPEVVRKADDYLARCGIPRERLLMTLPL